MTIPTLISKYNEIVTINQLKKTYAELLQVIKLSEIDNGPIQHWKWPDGINMSDDDFVQKYILSYFKGELNKCEELDTPCFGHNYSPTFLNGSQVDGAALFSPHYKIGNKTFLFVVVNREVQNTNPDFYISPKIRYVEIYVDINGDRGDSIVGKDVFVFTLFNYTYRTGGWSTSQICSDGKHYGLHLGGIAAYWGGYCMSLDQMFEGIPGTCNINSTGIDCGLAIEKNNWKTPDRYPINF